MIKYLKANYQCEIGKMKVSRGKIHEYFLMTLDYRTPAKVDIYMDDCVKKMIKISRRFIIQCSQTRIRLSVQNQ